MDDPKPVETVGAPTELADAEEVPTWIADLVKAITAAPILIAFVCGGLPLTCAVIWCIISVLL